jgi:LmbE family N-acetylglucosaminyl deacetylase
MEVRKTGFVPATILWVFAHPDDETLAAGGSLAQHREHDNHVIIMTDGSASGARSKTGLSVEAFVEARKKECLAAVKHAAVEEVTFAGFKDGTLTDFQVYSFVKEHIMHLCIIAGTLRVKGPTARENGVHPDHAAIARALARLYKEGVISDLREYAISFLFGQATKATFFNQSYSSSDLIIKNRMIDEYYYKNPSQGRYGIGSISVPAAFQAAKTTPERVLKPV